MVLTLKSASTLSNLQPSTTPIKSRPLLPPELDSEESEDVPIAEHEEGHAVDTSANGRRSSDGKDG